MIGKVGDRIQWEYKGNTYLADIAMVNNKDREYGVYMSYGQDLISFDKCTLINRNIIKRETFIEAIEAIQKQLEADIETSNNLGKVFINAHTANLLPDNHILSDALIKVLQENMNDTDFDENGGSWITWFCYELNFGEFSHRLKAYDKDKNVIKMDDAGDLYDFLNSLWLVAN